MKATIIFSTLIFFAVFTGCSDNLNVNDPLGIDNYAGSQSNQEMVSNGSERNAELLWKLDELSIKTVSQTMVEKKTVYTFPPSLPPYPELGSYLITFDGYTNANRFSNGYEALGEISWDNHTNGESQKVFEGTGAGTINGQKKIRLSKVSISEIKFYISLFQVDVNMRKQVDPSNICIFKLTNISIYRLN